MNTLMDNRRVPLKASGGFIHDQYLGQEDLIWTGSCSYLFSEIAACYTIATPRYEEFSLHLW